MPRRKVTFSQGHYYHIYNRGANRQRIFYEEENYLYLLRLLKKVSRELNHVVIAYALLSNHYHWLIRQDGEMPGWELPKRVFGSYGQAFNKRYQHSGTLFEGPFKAKHVDSDEYLLRLCAYIHDNPVKHGLVDAPEAWPYSNYPEWIGCRNGTLVDRAFVAETFPQAQEYTAFLEALRADGGWDALEW